MFNPRHREKSLAEMAQHIVHCASNLQAWTKTESASQWLEDEKSVMAVALCVQIIGEHANSLLLVWPDLLENEDLETWELLRELYHKIAHTYDGVNRMDLYHLKEEVDFLITWAEQLLKSLPKIAAEEALKDDPRKIYNE